MNKILNNFLAFFVIMYVGINLTSKFSYNIELENKNPKWRIFINHPFLAIKNKFQLEKIE